MQARGTARRPSCTWWATTRRLGTAARRAAGAPPAPPATPRAALHTAGSSGTSKTYLPSSSGSFPARDGLHAMRRVLQFRCCAVTSAPCCPPGMRVCLWGARVEGVPCGAAEVPSANLCWGSAVGNRPQNVRLDCGRELRRAQSCERCGATCAPHPPLFGEFSQHTARVPGGDSFRCPYRGQQRGTVLQRLAIQTMTWLCWHRQRRTPSATAVVVPGAGQDRGFTLDLPRLTARGCRWPSCSRIMHQRA